MATHKTISGESSNTSVAGQAEAESQLASFVEKFEPKYASLIRDCRKKLKKLLPSALELVYDNYNFLAIGYCSSKRASDCVVSIAAAANGVGLSFYHGVDLPDPGGILEGAGKQNRFIRIPDASRLGDADVIRLIAAAADLGKTPLPSKGNGCLIIKSVSAKQRPRQRTASAP